MRERKKYTFEEINTKLQACFPEGNIRVVSTEKYDLTTNPKGRNSKRERSKWADEVVRNIYDNMERKNVVKKYPRQCSSGELNFSYIKFGIDKDGNVYGLVSGKSSFHCKYPSDVWFYDFEKLDKKELEKYMLKNNMKWYTDKIIILKNKDTYFSKEAYENERIMKELFDLFD